MNVVEQEKPLLPLRSNREFRLLWSGTWVSFLGARMSTVCYPLLALWLTGGSATAAGVAGFAALLPNLLVQLPAGALVDRWDRRKVMLVCGAGRFLVLGSLAGVMLTGKPLFAHLLVVVFLDSGLAIFHALAERAAVRALVPAVQLGNAMSQNEARGRAAGLLGGPLGTVVFTVAKWGPYLAAAVGALIAVITVSMIRKDCQSARVATRRRLVAEIVDGFRWLAGQRFLRVAIALVSASGVLFQLLTLALVVILVKENGYAESSVGLLLAISGAGGLLGAFSAKWWMHRIPLPALVIGGFASWAALMPAMAFTTNPLLLGAVFAVMNVIGAVFNVAAAIYQLEITPDELQGRAAGTASFVSSGSSALGSLAAGFVLDEWGGTNGVLIAAAVMAVLAVLAASSPAVRHVRRHNT